MMIALKINNNFWSNRFFKNYLFFGRKNHSKEMRKKVKIARSVLRPLKFCKNKFVRGKSMTTIMVFF